MKRHRLEISFPPSVNARYMNDFKSRRHILTDKTRKWLKRAAQGIFLYCREKNILPISDYTFFDLWWFVPNRMIDTHNCEKALFDAFQKGELVKNDRFVLNRTQG